MPNSFYFSWTGPNTAFSVAHHVEDEKIISAAFDQSEGDFATLTVIVKNPKRGLLLGNIWAWFSWNNNISVIPLFYGRLIGIPDSINQELVTLVFQARPPNFKTLKQALSDTLKVFPYYDPIWISADKLDDPDTVLEGYTALWHIDPVTHVVTKSDFLVGEDGTEEFLENEVPYDSVNIKIGSPPKRSIVVTAKANWGQTASGTLDFGKKTFMTYTGGQLISDWPKPGASLGGGWRCISGYALDILQIENVQTPSISIGLSNEAAEHNDGDTLSINESSSIPVFRGKVLSCPITSKFTTVIGDSENGQAPSASIESTAIYVPQWQVDTALELGYDAGIGRNETLTFTLKMNVQPIVTLADEDEPLKLDLAAVDVSAPLNGTPPIGNTSRNAYFPIDRGLQSVRSAIMLARHQLIMTCRAVEITFQCKFERAIALSLRKNALLHDHRLPGELAAGKIIKYGWTIDGDAGKLIGTVTMGCAIGYGGTVAAVLGTGTYVDPGYIDQGYQLTIGGTDTLGDVGFTFPNTQPAGGFNFPLTRGNAVLVDIIHGSSDDQEAFILASFAGGNPSGDSTIEAIQQAGLSNAISVEQALKDNSVWWELQLKPLDKQDFETPYVVAVTDLKIPKMIDLEAIPQVTGILMASEAKDSLSFVGTVT